jgi:hypothetical protein
MATLPSWTKSRNDIVQALIERHLTQILPVVRSDDGVSQAELAGLRLSHSNQCLQKRRLPGSVGTELSEPFTATDFTRETFDEIAAGNANGDLLCNNSLISTSAL